MPAVIYTCTCTCAGPMPEDQKYRPRPSETHALFWNSGLTDAWQMFWNKHYIKWDDPRYVDDLKSVMKIRLLWREDDRTNRNIASVNIPTHV